MIVLPTEYVYPSVLHFFTDVFLWLKSPVENDYSEFSSVFASSSEVLSVSSDAFSDESSSAGIFSGDINVFVDMKRNVDSANFRSPLINI